MGNRTLESGVLAAVMVVWAPLVAVAQEGSLGTLAEPRGVAPRGDCCRTSN